MEYTVKSYVDAEQLQKDLSYSDADLTSAMMRQPSLIAHYGNLHADASRQTEVVKMLLENTEAAVYRKIREDMTAAGDKFTEAVLEKAVTRHPSVVKIRKGLIEARKIEQIAKNAVEAFRHRRDMLIQIGLMQREELKGEVRINAASARDQALDHYKQMAMEQGRKRLSAAGAE